MAKGLSVDIVQWLNTDVQKTAQGMLANQVQAQMQRVKAEQSQRSGGFAPDLESMVVDGRRNASLAEIKASSRILLDWNYITEATIKTVEYLRLHGPEQSGEWKHSIVVLVNGHEHDPNDPIPSDTAMVQVVVTAPYARKLEVGRTESGRAFSIQVSQHFVEKSCIYLRRQMADLAQFTFGYANISGAHVLRSKAGTHRRNFRSGRTRLGGKRHDTTVQYPAISISEIKALG